MPNLRHGIRSVGIPGIVFIGKHIFAVQGLIGENS